MNEDFINILTSGAKHFGFDYSPSTLKSFSLYNNMLKSYGETTNLTAIKDTADVARLHFLDSLAVLNAVDLKNKKVLDIGSGAGFPGIPLKLAEPSLDLTIIEATGKKVAFLVDLCNNLSINVKIIHNRAEELAKTQDMRERYDTVISRAVARLNILSELCLPFVCVGGFFAAMKSMDTDNEDKEAQNAITTLGGKQKEDYFYTLPDINTERRIVIIKKVSHTSTAYPRRYAKIQSSPL